MKQKIYRVLMIIGIIILIISGLILIAGILAIIFLIYQKMKRGSTPNVSQLLTHVPEEKKSYLSLKYDCNHANDTSTCNVYAQNGERVLQITIDNVSMGQHASLHFEKFQYENKTSDIWNAIKPEITFPKWNFEKDPLKSGTIMI